MSSACGWILQDSHNVLYWNDISCLLMLIKFVSIRSMNLQSLLIFKMQRKHKQLHWNTVIQNMWRMNNKRNIKIIMGFHATFIKINVSLINIRFLCHRIYKIQLYFRMGKQEKNYSHTNIHTYFGAALGSGQFGTILGRGHFNAAGGGGGAVALWIEITYSAFWHFHLLPAVLSAFSQLLGWRLYTNWWPRSTLTSLR